LITDFLELNYVEKQAEYKKITREFETKLVLMIGISIFFPFILTLFFGFYGLASNPAILFFVPLFIFLFNFTKSRFFNDSPLLFGELVEKPRISGSEKINLKYLEQEFEELLEFLMFFANSLKRNNSEEKACFDGLASSKITVLRNRVITPQLLQKQISIESFWIMLEERLKNPDSKKILGMLRRMLSKSSAETGSRLISMITQIKMNQQLIRERKLVFKAQQFKIRFLCLILNAVLGMLACITPLLYYSFQALQLLGFEFAPFSPVYVVLTWPQNAFLLCISIACTYFLLDLVGIENKVFHCVICLLVFLITLGSFSLFLY
ncbi:MAG: hypothetical protein ACXQS8_00025, partial [Candidatus Helarchaeales archaeon]